MPSAILIHSLLTDKDLHGGATDYGKRLTNITNNLFERSYKRISR